MTALGQPASGFVTVARVAVVGIGTVWMATRMTAGSGTSTRRARGSLLLRSCLLSCTIIPG